MCGPGQGSDMIFGSIAGLSRCRCHYQIRRSYVWTCQDHFEQLCLSKGKRAPAVLLPHEAKYCRHCQHTLPWMSWLQLPTTISLWSISTRSGQFFFCMVVQHIVVHNSHIAYSLIEMFKSDGSLQIAYICVPAGFHVMATVIVRYLNHLDNFMSNEIISQNSAMKVHLHLFFMWNSYSFQPELPALLGSENKQPCHFL